MMCEHCIGEGDSSSCVAPDDSDSRGTIIIVTVVVLFVVVPLFLSLKISFSREQVGEALLFSISLGGDIGMVGCRC